MASTDLWPSILIVDKKVNSMSEFLTFSLRLKLWHRCIVSCHGDFISAHMFGASARMRDLHVDHQRCLTPRPRMSLTSAPGVTEGAAFNIYRKLIARSYSWHQAAARTFQLHHHALLLWEEDCSPEPCRVFLLFILDRQSCLKTRLQLNWAAPISTWLPRFVQCVDNLILETFV